MWHKHQRAKLFQSLLPPKKCTHARTHLPTSLWSANMMMRCRPGEDVVPRREPLVSTHEFDVSRRCAVFNPLRTQALPLLSLSLSALPYVSPFSSAFSSLEVISPLVQVYFRWTSLSWTRLRFSRTLRTPPNSTITPSIRAESGVSLQGQQGAALGIMWGC